MGDIALDIPEAVKARSLALGPEGRAWLEALHAVVADLAREWDLTVGRVLHGGSEALVAEARTAAGRDVVLKIGVPGSGAGGAEARLLKAADGRGYAELIRHDEPRRAMVLERLGPRLSTLGYSIDRQIEVICATLRQAWMTPAATAGFIDGAEKAASLARFINETWLVLGRPCSKRAIAVALDYAERRRRAFSRETAVLAHGDAHAANTLLVVGSSPQRFKFIDPDGLFIEPAYDLGVAMRDWSADLLAGDAAALGHRHADLLAQLAGVETQPIWEWAFIERVSTGLHARQLGWDAMAADMLAVADRWAEGGDKSDPSPLAGEGVSEAY